MAKFAAHENFSWLLHNPRLIHTEQRVLADAPDFYCIRCDQAVVAGVETNAFFVGCVCGKSRDDF